MSALGRWREPKAAPLPHGPYRPQVASLIAPNTATSRFSNSYRRRICSVNNFLQVLECRAARGCICITDFRRSKWSVHSANLSCSIPSELRDCLAYETPEAGLEVDNTIDLRFPAYLAKVCSINTRARLSGGRAAPSKVLVRGASLSWRWLLPNAGLTIASHSEHHTAPLLPGRPFLFQVAQKNQPL